MTTANKRSKNDETLTNALVASLTATPIITNAPAATNAPSATLTTENDAIYIFNQISPTEIEVSTLPSGNKKLQVDFEINTMLGIRYRRWALFLRDIIISWGYTSPLMKSFTRRS